MLNHCGCLGDVYVKPFTVCLSIPLPSPTWNRIYDLLISPSLGRSSQQFLSQKQQNECYFTTQAMYSIKSLNLSHLVTEVCLSAVLTEANILPFWSSWVLAKYLIFIHSFHFRTLPISL